MWGFINRLVNQLILQDPKACQRLDILEGKRILIEITDLGICLMAHILDGRFSIMRFNIQSPDTIIKGPMKAYVSLLLSKDVHQARALGLEVAGDLDTGQVFRDLMIDLELDWEEWLSRYTGDIIANGIGRFARRAKEKKAAFAKSLSKNISEYLHEEVEVLPRKIEMEDFIQGVDLLKHDVERLEARIRNIS